MLPLLAPKSHFRWFGVPQTLTLPFKFEDTGRNFGGSFDGGWKTFGQWRINHDANDAMAWGPPLKRQLLGGPPSMVDYLAFFDDQHGNSTMGPP